MPLRVPPPEIPVISWLTPNKTDQGLLEFWNTEVASYVPLDIGAPHPNSRQYPNFRLGKQTPVQGDEKWTLRIWVTDETNPDWFDYALKYAGEDNAFPTFIRTYREPRATYAPRTKGEPLGTLYKLVVTDAGSGYANGLLPIVRFDAPTVAPTTEATAHGVVAPDGTISECVLDFGGDGYAQDVEFNVDAPVNGNPASGIAYVQPQTAILTREEAQLYPEDSPFYAQYLQVVRIYETIPGPTFTETKFDSDGDEITVSTTRKFCSDITTEQTIGSGSWCKTTSKPTDIDVICEEVVECRPIPGTEIDAITYPYGPNGRRVTASRLVQRSTYSRTTNGTANANFASALLVDERLEPVDGTDIVARKIGIYDEIPIAANQQGLGYFVEYPYDGDDSFPRLTWRFQILRLSATTVTDLSACPISGFTSLKLVDQKTEEADELIEVKVARTYEILPGKAIEKTTIDDAGDTVTETRTKVEASTITTTITTAGGVYTKTFEEPIGGLVAWKVVQVKATQNTLPSYEVSIRDLMPPLFAAGLPVTTTETTVIGVASLPTLGLGELMRRQAQIDYNTYRLTVSGRASISLPQSIVNKETTTEFGGGDVYVTLTLNLYNSLALEEGLTYLSSEIVHIDNQANGLAVRTTRKLNDTAWPELASRLWDENYRKEYDETRQVVIAGTSEEAPPGGSWGWVSEVKTIDKWRSWLVNTLKPEPAYNSEANALVTYDYKPYRFPGLLYLATSGYYVRHADATLVQHKIRTWWLKSSSTPTVGPTGGGADVEIDEIILDDVVISSLNSTTTLTYSTPVLHDDITTFGTLFYPATTPSYTQYALGTPTGTTQSNIAAIVSGGSGYSVSDVLTIAQGGFTMSVTVTYVYDVGATTGIVGGTTTIDTGGTFPSGSYGPIAATGGGGSGSAFNVLSVTVPTFTPGTEWIGTYRVIGAEIKPEKEKDIWKIVTESVVMR